MMSKFFINKLFSVFFLLAFFVVATYAQPEKRQDKSVRPVTIPITIFSKSELKDRRLEEFLEAGDLTVTEDGETQTILSIRDVGSTPLSLAVLIQDNLSSSFNLEISGLKDFIRRLPPDSRIMVAYLRSGSVQVRQRFTTDLEKAASALRIVTGSAVTAPNSPYESLDEALGRFDSTPNGRRAVLMVSDGFDNFRGDFPTLQNPELERAIFKAQRKSVAVYTIFTTTSSTENATSTVVDISQSLLEKLADETGGRAFFQGMSSPVSFNPFYKDLNFSLTRQFALTYLSTNPKKGYRKIRVKSSKPDIKIEHPRGYYPK